MKVKAWAHLTKRGMFVFAKKYKCHKIGSVIVPCEVVYNDERKEDAKK